jgi:hypothetical protein
MERIHSPIRESLMLKNCITDSLIFHEPHSIQENDPGPKRLALTQPTTVRGMYSSQDRHFIGQQCLLLRSYLIKSIFFR